MIRQTMPRLEAGRVKATLAFLNEAACGRRFHSGEAGTLLAGFKPAVIFRLPDSLIVSEVKERLSGLGFKYTSRSEVLKEPDKSLLPIRSGLIWSLVTACELYGETEQELTEQIAGLLTPKHRLNLPGHLLGYADDSLDPAAFEVDVKLRFAAAKYYIPVHFSRAKDPQAAEHLCAYYQAAALVYADKMGQRADVMAEVRPANHLNVTLFETGRSRQSSSAG
jgi:hypothetical protein